MKLRHIRWWVLAGLLIAGILFVARQKRGADGDGLPTSSPPPLPSHPPSRTAPPSSHRGERFPLPGDEILRAYRSPTATIHEDLHHVYTVLDNFRLLAKVDGALPLGSNEEIVQALTGENPVKLQFLSPDHPAIDAEGRLVDRWDMPLFFHALAHDRIEIRSAGPDRILWTQDDIHRLPNGLFHPVNQPPPASVYSK